MRSRYTPEAENSTLPVMAIISLFPSQSEIDLRVETYRHWIWTQKVIQYLTEVYITLGTARLPDDEAANADFVTDRINRIENSLELLIKKAPQLADALTSKRVRNGISMLRDLRMAMAKQLPTLLNAIRDTAGKKMAAIAQLESAILAHDAAIRELGDLVEPRGLSMEWVVTHTAAWIYKIVTKLAA